MLCIRECFPIAFPWAALKSNGSCWAQLDDELRKLMNATQNLWQSSSSLLTYCGGSRNRRNGIFAGVADIQGMDM